MPNESELLDAWKRVKEHIEGLKDALPSVSGAAARRQREETLADLQSNMDIVDAGLSGLPSPAGEPHSAPAFAPSSNIQDFFQAIGQGVRAAQQNLDDQSAAYIHNRPAFAPETVFRVPKVSANLKLGLTKTGTKGFNFIVINKSEETQEVEQEISFEIVAAPPPPDALEAITDLPLGQIIASNPIDRRAARARLIDEAERQKQVAERATGEEKTKASAFAVNADKMVDGDAFRHVLVQRGGGRYVLVFVPPEREKARPEFGMVILALPETADAEAEVVAKEYTRADTGSRPLLEVLIALADRQAELLTALERS